MQLYLQHPPLLVAAGKWASLLLGGGAVEWPQWEQYSIRLTAERC